MILDKQVHQRGCVGLALFEDKASNLGHMPLDAFADLSRMVLGAAAVTHVFFKSEVALHSFLPDWLRPEVRRVTPNMLTC